MLKVTFCLGSGAYFTPEGTFEQKQIDRIRTLVAELASRDEEEKKAEAGSQSQETPSETHSQEESKEQSKISLRFLDADIDGREVGAALVKMTRDEYWEGADLTKAPVLLKFERELLGKLRELKPDSDFARRADDLLNALKEPLLILFDLGGTLCYRGGPEDIKELGKPGYTLRKHTHYWRPNSDYMLQAVLEHPRAKVGFLTSITRPNALGLVQALFKQRVLEQQKTKLFALFDQEFQTPDVEGTEIND